jgi:hypothetical protein
MRAHSLWGLVLLFACHAHLGDGPADGNPVDNPRPIDGAVDAIDAPLGAWGTPARIMSASSPTLAEDDCTMSSDTLELYFAIVDATSMTKDLYVATRASKSVDFGPATKLPFNVAAITDETPRLSADNLTLYYGSGRAGGAGSDDIWFVQRAMVGAAWGAPQNLSEVNSTTVDKWFMPCPLAGSKDYLLVSNRGALTYTTLFEGTLGGGAPTKVAELDAAVAETGTFLTPDCLTLYFAMKNDIYMSTRTAIGSPWQTPTVVSDFSTATYVEQDPWESADQRTFIFASNAAGTNDIYMSTR